MRAAYSEWVNNMVITTVGSVAIPIERVAFPAITVCAQGMATIGSQEVVEAMVCQENLQIIAVFLLSQYYMFLVGEEGRRARHPLRVRGRFHCIDERIVPGAD